MAKRKKKKQGTRRKARNRVERAEYDYHLPVLLKESVDLLVTERDGIYIDGTLGGGGHAAEILSRLVSGGKLIALDLDKDAIEHSKKRFEEELAKGENSRIAIINECFDKACSIGEEFSGKVKGLLLDLGVSSRQLDSSEKGFSYSVTTDLDMRFGSYGKTAEALLNAATEEELERILRAYGEEPFASRIARRIVQDRRAFLFRDTAQLRHVVEESVPRRFLLKSLSRVFQAFRIAVNNELGILEYTLRNIIPYLAPGGRIVVISYHSLEDRIVKNVFREFSQKSFKEQTPAPGEDTKTMPGLRLLTKKAQVPSDEEININPRARSAKMRAAEKI